MESNQKIPVIAVVGPTASGKTKLAVCLAKRFNGEVVSCDSMQIYKTMDVATAKPTVEEMDGIPHHLVNFLDPTEAFSLAEYQRLASEAITAIRSRGKNVILVGGTGLYADTLLRGVQLCDQGEDSSYRAQLSREAEEYGGHFLMEQLMACDPEYAAGVHENNIPRLIRALEVYHTTGIPMSEHIRRSKEMGTPYQPVWIGINYKDRKKLYDRINLRVDLMVQNGLLKEAQDAFETRMSTAAQAIGCKELFPYFEGKKTLEACIDTLKQSTRHYAKRQLTWFKRNEDVHWLYPDLDSWDNIVLSAETIAVESGLFQ